jgi:hypothetical protein
VLGNDIDFEERVAVQRPDANCATKNEGSKDQKRGERKQRRNHADADPSLAMEAKPSGWATILRMASRAEKHEMRAKESKSWARHGKQTRRGEERRAYGGGLP